MEKIFIFRNKMMADLFIWIVMIIVWAAVSGAPATSFAQKITTVAGTGTSGYLGAG